MAITNAQLAQQISELLSYWRTRDVQFRDWLTGTADGGPYGDGTYPLTDYLAQTFYVKSPARLQQDVDGLVNSASSYADTAQSAASAAQAAQAAAETARDLAESYRVAALAHLDGAIEARLGAENAAANALGAATNAAASAAAALQSEANAALSEANAAISETNAAASAAAAAAAAAEAATFDPDNFAPSVHTHSWNEITNKPTSFTPSAHTHSASDITSGTLSNSRLSGVLAHQGRIGPGADLNTYTTTGIWHQESNANAASGTNYPVGLAGMLRVYADHLMVYQEYFAYDANATYVRKYYNGAWQPWHQVYDSGHKPSLGDLGGGTINGTLTVNAGAGALSLKPGSLDHVYMQFFADTQNPNTRSAYFGFGSVGSPRLDLTNEMAGGDIHVGTSNQIRLNASSTVVSGNAAINGSLAINLGGGSLVLKPGSQDRAFMQFYADSENPNTRSAYFGFGFAGNTRFDLVNEMGGDIYVRAGNQIRLHAHAIVAEGRGGLLHYADTTFTNARVFVRQGGSPVGTQEGDITIIW